MPEPSTASFDGTALEEPAVEELSFKEALSQALSEQLSNKDSIGSPRGMIEVLLPTTTFSLVYSVGRDLRISLICAFVPAVASLVWRLFTRKPFSQSISALIFMAIGAVIAVRTGRPEGVYVLPLLKNLSFAAIYALSIALRWPLVGVVMGFILGEQFHWRSVPERARAYNLATWMWVGMFALRLAVQLPLFFAGAAVALGLIGIPLGLPLFAVVLWGNWKILGRVPVALPPARGTITSATADHEAAIVIRSDEGLG